MYVFAELARLAENRNGKILRPRSAAAAALAFSRLANSYLCPYAPLPRGFADVVDKTRQTEIVAPTTFRPLGT